MDIGQEQSSVVCGKMNRLYDIALFCFLLGQAPRLFLRFGKGRSLAKGMRERLGRYPAVTISRLHGRAPIWVHAVSVGEVMVAEILIRRLQGQYPAIPIVLSTVTDTGRAVARKRLGDLVQVCYFPFDFPGPVARAIEGISPRLVLLTEAEIWPNFLTACHARYIPVLLYNGRISDRSYRRYRLVRRWLGDLLGMLGRFGMRTEVDAARILELGVAPAKVLVTGNLKYDLAPPVTDGEEIQRWRRILAGRPVVVAGSTHRGEERELIGAFRAIQTEFPTAVLILAPRHPERCAEVYDLVKGAGLSVLRRTAMGNPSVPPAVILLDTVGELTQLYALGDVAFIGGSLVPWGGQNLLEAAQFRRAVLFGPHMHNFQEIADAFLQEDPGFLVRNSAELTSRLLTLLRNPEEAAHLGEAGGRVLARNRGAVDRTLELIAPYLVGRGET